jgi:hypothetical protein
MTVPDDLDGLGHYRLDSVGDVAGWWRYPSTAAVSHHPPLLSCDCDRWDEATQSVVPEDRPHACRYQDTAP